jgi:hypothetical protein
MAGNVTRDGVFMGTGGLESGLAGVTIDRAG